MRLGLITDIHEHVGDLRLALAAFDAHGVDRIVCLGDVFQLGEAIHETVAILAAREIAGVWGNHDFGLSSHPTALESTRRAQYAGPVLDYLATYRPSLEIEDCHFSHVQPWRDLNDVMGLWCLDGPPQTPAEAARGFDAVPARVLFTGHVHHWHLATPAGRHPWDGGRSIRLLRPERYHVVVAAVCAGSCAVYDTENCELTPIAFRPQATSS